MEHQLFSSCFKSISFMCVIGKSVTASHLPYNHSSEVHVWKEFFIWSMDLCSELWLCKNVFPRWKRFMIIHTETLSIRILCPSLGCWRGLWRWCRLQRACRRGRKLAGSCRALCCRTCWNCARFRCTLTCDHTRGCCWRRYTRERSTVCGRWAVSWFIIGYRHTVIVSRIDTRTCGVKLWMDNQLLQ